MNIKKELQLLINELTEANKEAERFKKNLEEDCREADYMNAEQSELYGYEDAVLDVTSSVLMKLKTIKGAIK